MLKESYNQDLERRTLAIKLAKTLINGIINKDNELIRTEDYFVIDVTEDVLNLDSYFNGKKYLILIGDSKNNPNMCCGNDESSTTITFILPWIDETPSKMCDYMLERHKQLLNNYFIKCIESGMDTNEAIQSNINKIMELLRKEIIVIAKRFVKLSFRSFVHECTHAIDKIRYSKRYKQPNQDLDSEEGISNYFNQPEEQNAYFQETLYLVDELIKHQIFDRKSFSTFQRFCKYMKHQYYGNYEKLTLENKKRFIKRLYVYWKHIFTTPKYQNFINIKD